MALATLQQIYNKVRLVTRNPSESQLTTDQLKFYINTAIQDEFPQELRLFSLRSVLMFYTQPNVDVYETSTDPNNALYDFKNKYIAVHPPVYLAGVTGNYTQWRDQLYAMFPQTNYISDTLLRGNGTTGSFVGKLVQRPVLQNNVNFNCLDANGTAMILVDYPVSNTEGALGLINQPQTLPSPFGSVNYITGDFTLNFPSNTFNGAPINSETIPYTAGKPTTILFYENKFTIRPVPNIVYTIQVEVDVRPIELLTTSDVPQIEQWWQYIALLAARLIFEDRNDLDSVAAITPALLREQSYVLRSTLTTQCNSRTQTIYVQPNGYGGWFFNPQWPY